MYGLYIYSNDFTPQIHAFSTVEDARDFAVKFANDLDINIPSDGIIADADGFYFENDDCGILEIECRRINDHSVNTPSDSDNWRRQALEENVALDVARSENERLRNVVRKLCAEDGYSCSDCTNQDCPFCKVGM